ncbi:MAG: hypothetical protein HC838_00115 [Spirulinaceae cyanobacterium RM2_2_10]|nr:hypothetical protein [Spirulinaceae cyanobacterium RM2_2_10]
MTPSSSADEEARNRAKHFYFLAWDEKNIAAKALQETKLWERIFKPRTVRQRIHRWQILTAIEIARFEMGLQIWGAHWFLFIAQGPNTAKIHSIKGGKTE